MKKFINNNTHFIQQKGIGKYLNTLRKSPIFDISTVSLDISTWYDEESDDDKNFCWSKPNARIVLMNIDILELTISCPIGRDIIFKARGINERFNLNVDKKYTFFVESKYLTELHLLTQKFNPEFDDRSLGICLWNINYRNKKK